MELWVDKTDVGTPGVNSMADISTKKEVIKANGLPLLALPVTGWLLVFIFPLSSYFVMQVFQDHRYFLNYFKRYEAVTALARSCAHVYLDLLLAPAPTNFDTGKNYPNKVQHITDCKYSFKVCLGTGYYCTKVQVFLFF